MVLHPNVRGINKQLESIEISENMIEMKLAALKPVKSSGQDKIHTRLLKELIHKNNHRIEVTPLWCTFKNNLKEILFVSGLL